MKSFGESPRFDRGRSVGGEGGMIKRPRKRLLWTRSGVMYPPRLSTRAPTVLSSRRRRAGRLKKKLIESRVGTFLFVLSDCLPV